MAKDTIGTTAEPSLVRLDSITALPAWQVRNKTDEKVALRYADALRRESEFPSIRLARIGNGLFLIDGWHRVRAHRLLGAVEIWAEITDMDEATAKREAALANIAHGVSIKSSEKRRAFRLFIKGGGHRKGRGKKGYLSYREIAVAMCGMTGHTTIRNWMRKDFNFIYRAMGDDKSIDGPRDRQSHILTVEEELLQRYADLTQQLTSTVGALPDVIRFGIAKELERVFRDIGGGMTADNFVLDPNDIGGPAF